MIRADEINSSAIELWLALSLATASTRDVQLLLAYFDQIEGKDVPVTATVVEDFNLAFAELAEYLAPLWKVSVSLTVFVRLSEFSVASLLDEDFFLYVIHIVVAGWLFVFSDAID